MAGIGSHDLNEAPSVSLALLRLGLPAGDLARLEPDLEDLPTRWLAPGELLIREGDPPGDAYIIHEGVVEVLKRRPDGSVFLAAELGPGELVGEMSLLYGEPRSASVQARTGVRVFVLGRECLPRLARLSPVFSRRLALLAGERKDALARKASGQGRRS